MSESRHKLTDEQKREFYRDGFLILKKVIPEELAEVALDQIKQAKKGENLGGKKEMTDLVNASPLTPILHEAMGYFDPPIYCQVGVMKKSEPGDYFNSLGYKDKDMPYFGAQIHMDGSQTINAPQEIQQGTEEEIYYKYIASGPKGDLGRSADVMGHNSVPLFQEHLNFFFLSV